MAPANKPYEITIQPKDVDHPDRVVFAIAVDRPMAAPSGVLKKKPREARSGPATPVRKLATAKGKLACPSRDEPSRQLHMFLPDPLARSDDKVEQAGRSSTEDQRRELAAAISRN